MEAKFSLTWHSYSDHLKGMMKEIMASGDFADVTLICDGKEQIKAHKNILAACSPVLKDILQIENSSVIYLKGINFTEMESIIEYIYLGETTAYQEQMNGFLDVAKNLEIKGLTNEDDVPRKEEDLGRKMEGRPSLRYAYFPCCQIRLRHLNSFVYPSFSCVLSIYFNFLFPKANKWNKLESFMNIWQSL